jgi:hypothetical protein
MQLAQAELDVMQLEAQIRSREKVISDGELYAASGNHRQRGSIEVDPKIVALKSHSPLNRDKLDHIAGEAN